MEYARLVGLDDGGKDWRPPILEAGLFDRDFYKQFKAWGLELGLGLSFSWGIGTPYLLY